jgi:hypothetical protein
MLELKVTLRRGRLVFADPDGDVHVGRDAKETWDLLIDLASQVPETPERVAPSRNLPAVRALVAAEPEEGVIEAEFVEAEVVGEVRLQRGRGQRESETVIHVPEGDRRERKDERIPESLEGAIARGLASLAVDGLRKAEKVSSGSSVLLRGRRGFK